MQAMIDLADGWLGLIRLELSAWTTNTRGIEIYKSFGFQQEGIMRAYVRHPDGFRDAIKMARIRLP